MEDNPIPAFPHLCEMEEGALLCINNRKNTNLMPPPFSYFENGGGWRGFYI
jgi:hypothetical protein